jgi:glycosyltransferase involved in cell wall biosynthesis
LRELMQNARALIYPAVEDFGIVPVEAQACGTPVIALGKGGVCETVSGLGEAEPTGLFFTQQSESAIIDGVQRFEKEIGSFDAAKCRQNAERFGVQRFREQFLNLVEDEWFAFENRLNSTPKEMRREEILSGD